MANGEKRIVIAGAGSIGCYVGGCLALAGRKVVFLARPRIADALLGGGLRITDLDGRDRSIRPELPSPPIRPPPWPVPTWCW